MGAIRSLWDNGRNMLSMKATVTGIPNKPFTDSSARLGQPAKLRERALEDGYLFIRGLLPKELLLSVRGDFVNVLTRHGWLDDDKEPMEARTSKAPRIEGQPEYWPVFKDYWKLLSYHALPHRPEIFRVLKAILQDEVFLHPRHGSRVIFPHITTHSTPPHQDYPFIQGTEDTWSVWIPLGDCPLELGGLAVMPGTNNHGVYPMRPMKGAGGMGIREDHLRGEWHASGFECGDVLIFHGLTVHRGLHNTTEDRIRLSVDYRYQGLSQPIVEDGLSPTFGQLTWDEVYADWGPEAEPYKYSWRRFSVKSVARDPGIVKLDADIVPEERTNRTTY